jgi:hypothetical protein
LRWILDGPDLPAIDVTKPEACIAKTAVTMTGSFPQPGSPSPTGVQAALHSALAEPSPAVRLGFARTLDLISSRDYLKSHDPLHHL